MSYSDPKYAARSLALVGAAASFGTATASGAAGHTLSDVYTRLPKFKRRTKITAVRFNCTTIPNASSTGLIASLNNGTNVIGTAVLTTATAGQVLDLTITSEANSIVAADTEPTFSLVGTSTASAAACGAYDIWFETQELFS